MSSEPLAPGTPGAGPRDAAIRAQLDRIVQSEFFNRSERLSRFLRFVVEQTLAGGGDGLKEQVVAAEVYDKRVGFNAADDPAVRNDARRLRDKLREYYATFPDDPVTIGLPKGGYVPAFELRQPAPLSAIAVPAPEGPPAVAAHWGRRTLPVVLALAVVAGVLALMLGRTADPQPIVWPVIPVSSLPGSEGSPTLSPDGNFVAWSWYGPDNKVLNGQVLVKAVGHEDVRALAAPGGGNLPAWSPDGKLIAFQRQGELFVVSPLAGPERRVSESGSQPSWTPDSRSLVLSDTVDGHQGIYELSLDTLQRRQITHAPGRTADFAPRVSPDGRTVAFIRTERPALSNVYVVPMDGGEPQQRTDWYASHLTVAWTPDGRELIYDVGYGYPLSLWRVFAFGARPERGMQIVLPSNGIQPSFSKPSPGQPSRLAFVTVSADISLRLLDLDAPRSGDVIESVQPLFDSTLVEYPGSFSADGRRIAFTSNRGEGERGPMLGGFAGGQLWVAGRDGTGLQQVTKFVAPVRHPAWSPDGRRIAFHATVGRDTDVFVVSVDGGEPRRLTHEASWDQLPTWSQDGKTIYFDSDRSGQPEIWKVPADGGDAVQITREGGIEPIESPDGKSIYYVAGPPGSARRNLKQVSIAGGPETVVLDAVMPAHWAVTTRGIFFLMPAGQINSFDREFDDLYLYDPGRGGARRLGRLPFVVTPVGTIGRFTVSPDGRWALSLQEDRFERDIAMVENFR